MVHTRNNADGARQVSRKLGAGEGLQRQPGRDTLSVNCESLGVTSVVEESMVLDHSVSQSSDNRHSKTQTIEGGKCVYEQKTCGYEAELDTVVDISSSCVIRLSLGKLLVNLLQVVRRTDTPLIPSNKRRR